MRCLGAGPRADLSDDHNSTWRRDGRKLQCQITVLHKPIQGIMRIHRHKGSHGNTGKEQEEGRRERLSECESYVSSSEPRPRLKWQLVIWLSCPDWEERRRRICRPSKAFIGSVASQTSVFFLSIALLPLSLPAASGFSRMTVACVLLYSHHKYMLI